MRKHMRLSIRDIINACGGEAFVTGADPDKEVSSVVLDSRLVTEGGVFIAQKGEKVDGHSFIAQVFEKGAALVICEMDPEQVRIACGVDPAAWGDHIIVKDSLAALRDIAKAYREKFEIPFVGITGSVGKTSTKEFIAGVLSEKYNVLKTEGNYNNEIGVPLTLLRIRDEHEAAVIEMGISDFGEMTRLTSMVKPDIAVITNIGQCHLENLKTRDGILKAKSEIFSGLRDGGRAVLFGGDDKLVTVGLVGEREPVFFGEGACTKKTAVNVTECTDNGLLGSKAKLVFSYGGKGVYRKNVADPEAAAAAGKAERNFDISLDNEEIEVNVPLPGHHMVVNASAAACVSMLLGLSCDQIKAGIEHMKPIAGRNNIITVGDLILIDDCYNANPVSMRSSLDLLKLAKGRTVAILGDMFELGKNEKIMHSGVGEYAVSQGVDSVFCVGTLAEKMYEGAKEASAGKDSRVAYWKTRDEMINALREDITGGKRELVPPGSAVLVKASHGMHFEEIVRVLTELLSCI